MPASLLTVAEGFSVRVVSASPQLAPNIDQIALWPSDTNPTHLIACNEQGSGQIGVQSIDLRTGTPHTIILSGLTSCDPTRRTPWGTIIVGEENSTSGRIFEILDPLNTTNVTVPSSGFGDSSDPAHVVGRPALGQFAFEGIGILPNGVVYLTDENRPGTGGIGNPGGAILKFIPSALWTPGNPAIRIFRSRRGLRELLRHAHRPTAAANRRRTGQRVRSRRVGIDDRQRAAQSAQHGGHAEAHQLLPSGRHVDRSKVLNTGSVRFCGTATGQDVPADTGSQRRQCVG